MGFRRLFSRSVRGAERLRRRVQKEAYAQRDVLTPQARETLSAAIYELRTAIASNKDAEVISGFARSLVRAEQTWLRRYSHRLWRSNTELLLVAVTVAVTIRTFFFQPYRIPTGSMEPTLYGMTAVDLRDQQPGAAIPGPFARLFEKCVKGVSYCHVVAQSDGMFESFEPPRPILPLLQRQRFKVGDRWYSVWSSWDKLLERAGLDPGRSYHKGDDIVKARIATGDHVFVDRLTYNFRRPIRGELVVFDTKGLRNPANGEPIVSPDTFYIKRLVATGGERIQIGNDRHLTVNGRRLDRTDSHFEGVYSFDPKQAPKPAAYSGHLNDRTAARYGRRGLAPLFPDATATFTVSPDHYFVLGDNTLESWDGRAWGDFPRTNVVGRFWFVYWPMNRFGCRAP